MLHVFQILLEAFRCGMWGDVSNCRVAFSHRVSVLDFPGLHGWHLDAQQPLEKEMAEMAEVADIPMLLGVEARLTKSW